ncbi:baseplate hub + tail lysozyme [Agrobacterium phage Atu_ph04]|uniref:Baseplate hub + tail lysozyme n=1 Tax=Agrobacterium phage Atu_ph04 TaxID=2024263 RepID=A0A223VZT7_9CAUD|nr:baseplate hub subunit and tail lysozyme [Agrobacterium phage Atu_ph04]ASV44683.1 baseplate hub + tail lysozyme [Agrobacterium phage Atu_ph04]
MRGILPSNFGDNVRLRVGVVEDRTDPKQQGRVRVRIFGHHIDDKSLIPTDALPWAITLQPANSAAMGGVGTSPTGLMIGSLVLVSFLDGNDMQQPVVLGSLGQIEGIIGQPSIDGQTGTITSEGVMDNYAGTPGNVQFSGSEPPWLSIAKAEIGVKEFNGAQSNPRILEYLKNVGINSGDETPWCSAFAKWCMDKAGVSTSGINGMAKSWSRSGSFKKLDKPLAGCIAVFNRGPNPQSGHVAFLSRVQGGRAVCIGGNQSNAVKESPYPLDQLVGWYWPSGFATEAYSALS